MPAPQFRPDRALLVYVTAPSREVAERLARNAVEQRLAACVNMLPGMRSVYRWEGHIEEAEETVLLFKTTGRKVNALQQFIDAEHPYDTPCSLVIDIDSGLPAYLKWVNTETV